jgi:hypothetical protein
MMISMTKIRQGVIRFAGGFGDSEFSGFTDVQLVLLKDLG